MKNKLRHKGEHHLRYNLIIWKNKGDFNILDEISENVTLVQLMDTLLNVNHSISIVRSCIFDSDYEKSSSSENIIVGSNMLSFCW